MQMKLDSSQAGSFVLLRGILSLGKASLRITSSGFSLKDNRFPEPSCILGDSREIINVAIESRHGASIFFLFVMSSLLLF